MRLDGTPSVWSEKALTALEELVQDRELYIETITEASEDSLPSVELHIIRNGELQSVREGIMGDRSLW